QWIGGPRGWVLLTQTNGVIGQAVMRLNTWYNWPGGTAEVQKVALHEFGHWLFSRMRASGCSAHSER
ncbi:MAG TPA: hypothetical protein VJP78_00600, partial [Thermoleophilia bacterium]|nr:hypothetical protein [Thermoleophilia bacterium]